MYAPQSTRGGRLVDAAAALAGERVNIDTNSALGLAGTRKTNFGAGVAARIAVVVFACIALDILGQTALPRTAALHVASTAAAIVVATSLA